MPDEIAERICDAHWNQRKAKDYGVSFIDIHQHNACNHTLTGIVEVSGERCGFVVESGDWNGFVVKEYGPAEECSQVYSYEPPPETRFMFVPTDDNLQENRPGMYQVYLQWKKTKWFQEKLGGYHYDRHFQPGFAIENHYKKWALEKGLKIVAL